MVKNQAKYARSRHDIVQSITFLVVFGRKSYKNDPITTHTTTTGCRKATICEDGGWEFIPRFVIAEKIKTP